MDAVSDSAWGLSPRVRGNLIIAISRPPVLRSIPACAGEPGEAYNRAAIARVYPRVCGGTALTPGTIPSG